MQNVVQVVKHLDGHVEAVRRRKEWQFNGILSLCPARLFYSLEVDVIPSDLLQLASFQGKIRRYPGISLVELDLGDEELGVVLDARPVPVLQVAPELAHLRQHGAVAHRMLATQVMALAQHFMEEVAELPRGDSVVQQRLSHGHGPEGVRPLAMEGADDRRPGMFHLQRILHRAQGFTDADRL